MKFSSLVAVMGPIIAFTGVVVAQGEPENIEVPKNSAWTAQVNTAAVPALPVRPVGSGICQNPKCDGTDNDRCFESCGNKANQDDIYGCPQSKQWALTFDDGPSNFTIDLLNLLDTANVKVTFCVMGAHVKKYPEIVKRAYDAGHHIASHTYSHPHLMSLSNEEIITEMKATEEAIVDAIGVKPKYMRPPFGEADDRVKSLMKAMGYKILLWNADPTDYNIYKEADVGDKIQATFQHALGGIDTGLNVHEDPGFISLQHDLYTESIAQVPNIIKLLQGNNFQLMTAAQCLGDNNPYQGGEASGSAEIKNSNINAASIDTASVGSASSASVSMSASAPASIVPAAPSFAPQVAHEEKSGASATLSFMPLILGISCLVSVLSALN